MATDAIRAGEEDAPTTELVTSVVGDRCANCQAPLAPDQHYCVNCGERRGRPRFSYESTAAQAAPEWADDPFAPRQRSRFSPGTSLIAGVATLLIALGVGVLIGHDSNSSTPARAPAPQVITIGGGTATGGAAGTPTTSSGTTAGAGKAAKGKTKVTTVHVTAKTAKAATSAAGKVLGSSGNLSNNVSQSVGGGCSGGSGCQNGKFTGNFFPGG